MSTVSSDTTVALVQTEPDVSTALRRAFDLLAADGGPTLAERAGRLVTIKPNLTAPRESGSGIVSDVAVVEALIQKLRADAPDIERIVVADGPGMVDASRCFTAAGYDGLADDYGVELLDLNLEPTRTVEVPDWLRYPTLEIPNVVLDADLFVSITPVKTHTDGLYTVHAKNMFGVPPNRLYGRPRRAFHRAGVPEVVYDICRAAPIDLAIIDGLVGLQLGDPIDGEPVKQGVLAVGWNAQAVDVVGCALMGVDPIDTRYLAYLRAAGVGPISLDELHLVGDPLQELAQRFATPDAATLAANSQRTSAH